MSNQNKPKIVLYLERIRKHALIVLFQQNLDRNQVYKANEGRRRLIIVSCGSEKDLDFVKKELNEMALFVSDIVIWS